MFLSLAAGGYAWCREKLNGKWTKSHGQKVAQGLNKMFAGASGAGAARFGSNSQDDTAARRKSRTFTLCLRDAAGRELAVDCAVTSRRSGLELDVLLSCPVWLIDRTGLDLAFAAVK